ncbi:MAG TPA: hypothetical protein VFG69_01935 [Nannocystaceae bacterium]|nr:hypothetical protein [Nannocystaceae bacterium]
MNGTKGSRLLPGILLLAFGATCNAIGIGLTVSPKEGDPKAGIFWVVFSLAAMIVPGALLVISARRQAQRTARMQKIVALATASQRLPFAQLATDLGVTAVVAREMLLEAIGQRWIIGRLDLEEGVFVSGSTHGGVQQLTMTCRNCGGRSTVIVSAGSTSHCQYCGFRLA